MNRSDELSEEQARIVAHPVDDEKKFHERFWDEKVTWRLRGSRTPAGDLALVIDGYHFTVGKEHGPGYQGFLGMAGRRFDIVLEDGTKIVTHNLWGQGDVPPEYRDRLPDNARFDRGASVARDTKGKAYAFDSSKEPR